MKHFDFRPASDCLSDPEASFVAEFVVQVVEYAKRSGQEILVALDNIGRVGQSFDWRTTEFLAIQRVRIAIREKCAAHDAMSRVSAETLRNELSAIAFSDMGDYLVADPEYPDQVTFNFANLTAKQRKAISEVSYEESVTGGKRRYKLKLHSKVQAIAQLGEHVGFNDPSNPYRAKELAREVTARPLDHFAPDAPLSGLQDAYARMINE